MKRSSLLGVSFACALTITLPNVAQAAPFVIDDFNVNNGSSVMDGSVGGSVSGPSVIDGANIVMNGAPDWERNLIADLSAGDGMTTSVCIFSMCGAGHVSMNSGSSTGIGTFEYNGTTAIDLSSYALLGFDWGADMTEASVDIIFSDSSSNTETVASWSSLAATPGNGSVLEPQTRMRINWGALDSSAITQIQFVVDGVGNLDANIDNITAYVPVPGAALLFGSALLGLGGVKRRKA